MESGMKKAEGQLAFDFCLDNGARVVQANDLIEGRQALKLNSAKLIRSAIMQAACEGGELLPYVVKVPELSKLLGVSASNIYRDVEDITNDIARNPVHIREVKNGKTERFIKIPWVAWCEYRADVGIAIKLNEKMKPFFFNLKEHYTQYPLQEVLAMKSVYAIRVFEVLQSKLNKLGVEVTNEGAYITLSVQELRECCNCEDKYPAFGDFKKRVLDKAVAEIRRVTRYILGFSYEKSGKSVVSINFFIAIKTMA